MCQVPNASRFIAALLCTVVAGCGSDRSGDDSGSIDRPAETAPAARGSGDAQAGGAISDSEIRTYRLDMPTLQQWHQVQLVSENRPDISIVDDEEDADLEDDDAMDGAQASRLLRRIEDHPEASAAVREAGMSVRDYVLVSIVLSNALVGSALEQAGHEPPPLANRQNIDFVRQNQAAIERMRAEQRAARTSSR